MRPPISEALVKKLKMDKYNQISLLQDAKEDSPFSAFSKESDPSDLCVVYVYSLEEMKEVIESQFQAKQLKVGGQLFSFIPRQRMAWATHPSAVMISFHF